MSTQPGDFTPQAKAYARARPHYPDAMVDQLVRFVGLARGELVVDVGAGTGLFTEKLAERGLEVVALEPNASMRAGARNVSGVRWTDGTFEDPGLEDDVADWVVAAQAFHWADPERALPQMRRILKAEGCFTVLWNNRDVERSELLTYTRERIERMVPAFDEGYRARDWSTVLMSTGHFSEVEVHEVRHEVQMTPERFCDLWRSHNLLNAAAGAEGIAALIEDLEGFMASRGMVERFPVPYRCRAFTAM